MLENVRQLAAELKPATGKKVPVPPEIQAIERELAETEKQRPPPSPSPWNQAAE